MMVNRSQLMETYLEILRGMIRGKALKTLGTKTSVIDSGLVDSFALADVITKIETTLSVQISVERLSPGDFDTAELLADRLTQLGVVQGP